MFFSALFLLNHPVLILKSTNKATLIMATLGFRFSIDGFEDETLVVREYQGHESMSDSRDSQGHVCFGFRYQIELASRRSDITPQDTVDRKGLLEVIKNGEVVQRVHGVIRRFSKGDTGHSHSFYSITLVPSLERLSLRHNSRIFQQQSVPEILSILLQEMNITDYAFSVKRDCEPREFCVQYRESDLAFFHRLAAEEGLVYSFVHYDDKHLLYITDASESQPKLDSAVTYNVLAGGADDTPYVSQFTQHTKAEVSSSVLQEYHFKQPNYRFSQSQLATNLDYQLSAYEHYDMPGRYVNDAVGKAFNAIRLEYLRREAHTANGKSNQAALQAGVKFDLEDHLDDSVNREWLLIQVSHQGKQPQALEEHGGAGETTYANQFYAIPSDINWRATPITKPQVDGDGIAFVVGPEGEEIYCDEHGRVKLHFPWDRYSNGDENSSCWVRVSQGWAGAQYGMMAIPRIGHEVIVSFLNGDPDQPIVTGRTYHATNQAPYALPANKTKTVIRTETHQGSGFNELSFEDQSGSEKIYLHGQKDYQALIENDQILHIKHDSHATVENDRYSNIKVNDHLTIDGEQRVSVAADHSTQIGASLQQQVGSLTAVNAGSAIHLKSGAKIVVEAGAEITLKAGGSFVHISGAGVNLVGPAINLCAGGSASSAKAYSGAAAMLPGLVEKLANPEPILTVAQIATLKSAAPFCEECEKCKDGACAI
jgi:type VI secretion system secreted protein VgrG